MRNTRLIVALLAIVLVMVWGWGCERKVVNEITNTPVNIIDATACMSCHGDTSLTFVVAQQGWKLSKHGIGAYTGENRNADAVPSSTSSHSSCERCHTAEGFLAYINDTSKADGSHFSPIGCFTCHAPHTTGTLALRVTKSVKLENGVMFNQGMGNLCAMCHHSRQNVTTYVADSVKLSTRFGPHHGPQGDLLQGTGGYQYAGYTYTNSPHQHVTMNGCVDCHMAPPSSAALGGHTWTMAVGGEEGETQNITGCNVTRCHDNGVADFDYKSGQTDVLAYMDSLAAELVSAGVVSYNINVDDNDTSFAPVANKILKDKDSTGAIYNLMMIQEDRSEGVHNTQYILGLLKSSLNYIRYGDPNGEAAANKGLYSAH